MLRSPEIQRWLETADWKLETGHITTGVVRGGRRGDLATQACQASRQETILAELARDGVASYLLQY